MTRSLTTDRVEGARSDDRQAGKGTASPLFAFDRAHRRRRLWK
jgi:hypothetical protein